MKRMLQKQGQIGPDGQPVAPTRQATPARPPQRVQGEKRASAFEFLRDVRGELRKVAWPSRAEVLNYSLIVLITLILLVSLIFVLDFLFAKSVLFLFET